MSSGIDECLIFYLLSSVWNMLGIMFLWLQKKLLSIWCVVFDVYVVIVVLMKWIIGFGVLMVFSVVDIEKFECISDIIFLMCEVDVLILCIVCRYRLQWFMWLFGVLFDFLLSMILLIRCDVFVLCGVIYGIVMVVRFCCSCFMSDMKFYMVNMCYFMNMCSLLMVWIDLNIG